MINSAPFINLQQEFIRILEDMFQFRGLDPLLGRIYGIILLSPTPLVQEDLANATKYSRSQISRLLKQLEDTSMVRKQSKPGSKTMFYEATPKSFLNTFRKGVEATQSIITEKGETLKSLTNQWNSLTPDQQQSELGRHIQYLFGVFQAHFRVYLETITQFIQQLDQQIKELEKKRE
ncbi:MAG: GbsR/MarR family transcriptional regulator [Candidatus Hodarchaeota archaeon]